MIHILCSCLSICGNREYHNIVTWNYRDLLKVLSSNKSSPTQTYRVTKEEELGKLLDTDKIRDKGCLQLVEVVMDREDAPPALRRALKKHEETDMPVNMKIGDVIYQLGMIGW